MRTTVDIDKDLLDRVRKAADREGRSFREELNLTLRRGLLGEIAPPRKRFVMPTFDLGVLPGIPLGKLVAWADEQDDLELMQTLRDQERSE
jgi:hypothetical protein